MLKNFYEAVIRLELTVYEYMNRYSPATNRQTSVLWFIVIIIDIIIKFLMGRSSN